MEVNNFKRFNFPFLLKQAVFFVFLNPAVFHCVPSMRKSNKILKNLSLPQENREEA